MFNSLFDFLQIKFLENTLFAYFSAILFVLALCLIFYIVRFVVVKINVKKTKMKFDDALINYVKNIPFIFYLVVALYFGQQFLILPQFVSKFFYGLFIIALVWQGVAVVLAFLEYLLYEMMKKNDAGGGEMSTMYHGLKLLLRIALWSMGALLILSNLGFDITSLVASLGIGGVAVALAVQNILGDIFSSFSIYFDRPFEVGDYIKVGADEGTVKKIGLKTTRLMSIQGEELVISNKELTSVRVQNYKKMKRRRISKQVLVHFETSADKLKKIPEILEKIVEKTEDLEFARAHLAEIGEYGYQFDLVYFVLGGDYKLHMDRLQEINLGIIEDFDKEKIELLFLERMVR